MRRNGIITLTEGNIKNNHFYLRAIMDLFPEESVGGGSSKDLGSQLLTLDYGFGEPVLTDIAGDKKIFRKRGWIGEFFKQHQLSAGDSVVVEQVAPFKYRVFPKRD